MKDIQVIGTSYQRGSFELLEESVDRLRSCHYFCDETKKYATAQDDLKARWYFRASLSSYQSALDNIDGDIKRAVGKNTWDKSEQKSAMYSHPLVKILSKARNFAVHSSRLKGIEKDYYVTVLDGKGERVEAMRSLFFEELHKKKNFRDASSVSSDELQWFNRQAVTWPVDLLIRHGLYEASTYVHHFCAVNGVM